MPQNTHISVPKFTGKIREFTDEINIPSYNKYSKMIVATNLFNFINNNIYIIINETKNSSVWLSFIDTVYKKSEEFIKDITNIENEQYMFTKQKRKICSDLRKELLQYKKTHKVLLKLI